VVQSPGSNCARYKHHSSSNKLQLRVGARFKTVDLMSFFLITFVGLLRARAWFLGLLLVFEGGGVLVLRLESYVFVSAYQILLSR
jgi:hypothetical protein